MRERGHRAVVTVTVLAALVAGCDGAKLPSDLFSELPLASDVTWSMPTGLENSVVLPEQEVVDIGPDEDVLAIMASHGAGTTYRFAAGIYRELEIVPKKGDVFIGEDGAVLSGARLLTEFDRNGQYWSVGGLEQEGERRGRCRGGGDLCTYPEDLYVDDQLVQQVDRMQDLQTGTWYFDYGNDTVYLADDPTGHKVELASVPYAFGGTAPSVIIKNLVVEKYASPAQRGAVGAEGTFRGWIVVGCEIRFNHGDGVKVGSQARVLANFIHHNGLVGLEASGDRVSVEGNELAYNNTGGFNLFWGSAGAKFVLSTSLEVINNYAHHNLGPGLWTDIDNIDTTYDSNVVVANYQAGIKHEISYDAVISNNTAVANGFGDDENLEGAGIYVASSPNVEIYGNHVSGNHHGITGLARERGDGKHGPHELRSLYVHDNVVEMGDGYTGIMSLRSGNDVYTSWGNRFERNQYTIVGSGMHFWWLGRARTFDEWTSFGMDTAGSATDK